VTWLIAVLGVLAAVGGLLWYIRMLVPRGEPQERDHQR
jgi:hypothetical protein